MKVLVTGASGFIGHKTALYYQKNGFEVLGWSRSTINKNIKTNSVDLFDENATVTGLKEFKPEILVHCAGSADVGKSVKNPVLDYDGNVTITHNLLFALHKLGLEKTRFVFLSSAGVYGNPQSLPITENMPLNPLSPYALHKVMCEEICKYFISNYGINIKVARIFSAYGAGLRKQIFWDMHQKFKRTGRLEMFGTGNESRDYIHVDDVAQSLYLLGTTKSNDVIFNVANGEEIKILEATEMFAARVGCPLEHISFNGVNREGDPLNWRADISKIKALGYKETVSMKEGISSYVDWLESL